MPRLLFGSVRPAALSDPKRARGENANLRLPHSVEPSRTGQEIGARLADAPAYLGIQGFRNRFC